MSRYVQRASSAAAKIGGVRRGAPPFGVKPPLAGGAGGGGGGGGERGGERGGRGGGGGRRRPPRPRRRRGRGCACGAEPIRARVGPANRGDRTPRPHASSQSRPDTIVAPGRCAAGAPSRPPRSGARKLAPERSERTRRAPRSDPRAA